MAGDRIQTVAGSFWVVTSLLVNGVVKGCSFRITSYLFLQKNNKKHEMKKERRSKWEKVEMF